MKDAIRIGTIVTLAALLCAASYAASDAPPRYLGIQLLTTNDLHANLLPFDEKDKAGATGNQTISMGGAPRRATIVNRIRCESSIPVLLFDSGDTTYGTNPLARAYHGEPDVVVMNTMGYEAMEPGNHEFQWPSVDTLRNLKCSRFPWVCANLVNEKTGRLFLRPYVIRQVWGVRVAVFGLITSMVDRKPYKAARELGLHTTDPVEAASKLVPELRKQADIVILLSHLGVKQDVNLAQKVPGIDIILGGHTHTRLLQPKMVPTGEPTAFSIAAVPVVQAHRWGSEMGNTRVIFRRDPRSGKYTLMSCKGELIPLTPSVPDDPEIAGIIRGFQSRITSAPYAPRRAAVTANQPGS